MAKSLAVILLACAMGAQTATSVAATAEGSFERTLRVSGAVDLDVQTGAGSITVRPGAVDTVQIIGRIRAQDTWFGMDGEEKVQQIKAAPPIEQNGNRIRIGRIQDRALRRNVSISYEILTPEATSLRASSGSGDILASGLRGPAEASTGSGDITVSNIGDGFSASTGSGDVTATSIAESVKAVTGSGDIRVTQVSGGLDATTGSGDVQAVLIGGGTATAQDVRVMTGSGGVEVAGVRGALRARTGSGGITISGDPLAAWNVDAGSGGIRVDLPDQAAFDLRAETGSGRITIEHPLTVQGAVRPRALAGRVRGGGPLVALSSGSGGIRID
jgi:DUF4097 and DUF4098 domain-containing protein YvlB